MTQKLTHKVKNPNYAEPNHQTWIDIYEIDGNDQVNLHGKLSDPDAVTSSVIASGAITSAALAISAVTSNTISAGAVTSAAIAASAVTSAAIAANAVTSAKIQPNAVGTIQLSNNAVTSDKLQNNAVISDKIRDNAVNINKLYIASVNEQRPLTSVVAAGSGLSLTYSYVPIIPGSIGTNDLNENIDFTDKIKNHSLTLQKLVTTSDNSSEIVRAAGSGLSATASEEVPIPIVPSSIGTDDLAENIIQNKHVQVNQITLNKMQTQLTGVIINEVSPEEMYRPNNENTISIWTMNNIIYEPDVSTITPAQKSDETSSFSFIIEPLDCIYNLEEDILSISGNLSGILYYQEKNLETSELEETFDIYSFTKPLNLECSIAELTRVISPNYIQYQLDPSSIISSSVLEGLFNKLAERMLELIQSNEIYYFENLTSKEAADALWAAFDPIQDTEPSEGEENTPNAESESENSNEGSSSTSEGENSGEEGSGEEGSGESSSEESEETSQEVPADYIDEFLATVKEDLTSNLTAFYEKYLESTENFILWGSIDKMLSTILSQSDYDKIGIWIQI